MPADPNPETRTDVVQPGVRSLRPTAIRAATRSRCLAVPIGTGLVLSCLASLPLHAQQVDLRWQFSAGDVHVYEQSWSAEFSNPVLDIRMHGTTTREVEIVEVSDDGTARVNVTVTRVRGTMESPAGQFSFDSEQGDAPASLASAVGTESERTAAPDGSGLTFGFPRLLEADALQQVADTTGAGRGDVSASGRMVAGLLGAQPALSAVPGGPASPGVSWRKTNERAVPPFGTVASTARFTLERLDSRNGREVAVIRIESGDPEIESDRSAGTGPVWEERSGEILFDADNGVLVEATFVARASISSDPNRFVRITWTNTIARVER